MVCNKSKQSAYSARLKSKAADTKSVSCKRMMALSVAAAAAALLCGTQGAQATSYSFDPDGTTPISTGTGVWDLSTANWVNGGVYSNWSNSLSDTATFISSQTANVTTSLNVGLINTTAGNQGGIVVNLASGVVMSLGSVGGNSLSWSSSSGGFVINGPGILSLTGNTAFAAGTNVAIVNSAVQLQSFNLGLTNTTVNGVITGTGGIVGTSGSLGGLNTFTGNVSVNGVLRTGSTSIAGVGGALGVNTNVTLTGTGQLNLRLAGVSPWFNTTVGSLAGAAGTSVDLYRAVLTVGTNNTDTTFAGNITYSAGVPNPGNAFTKVGTGNLTLSGNNTYDGATTITGGILRLDFALGGTNNINSASSTLLLGGGTLEVKGGSGETDTQTVNGVAGAGAVKLTSNSATSINLTLGAVAATSAINFAGSDATSSALGNFNFLTTSGTGTGATRLGASLWNGTGWAATSTNGANHVVDWTGTYSDIATDASATNSTGDLRITGGSAAGTATTYSASTTIGSLLMAESAYGSTVNLNSGTVLTVGSGASPTNAAIAINTGGNSLTIGSAVSQGTLTAGASGATTLNLANFNGASTLTVNSVLANNAGAGVVSLSTSGNVILKGANTYTGATTILGGVVNVQNNTAFGTIAGGVTIAEGAAVQFQGGINTSTEAYTIRGYGFNYDGALRNISGNNTIGAVVLANVSRINSDADTLTIGAVSAANNVSYTLVLGGAGNISTNSNIAAVGIGVATVIKDGSGTVTFTSSKTYTGATTVLGGTLTIASGGLINSTSGVSIDGGNFNYNSSTALTKAVTFTNNGGTLSGNGTISALVTTGGNTSVLSPGNSPKWQAYTAGLNAAPGARLKMELSGDNTTTDASDKLVITGGSGLIGPIDTNGLVIDIVSWGFGPAIPNPGVVYTLVTFDASSGLDPGDLVLGTMTSGLVLDTTYGTANGFHLDTSGGGGAGSISVKFTSVPEPTSLALVGLGIGGMLGRRRRNRTLPIPRSIQ